MGTYSLTVEIDSNQYPVLKAGGYNLCVAKKVNGVYNVVWSGADFLQNNYFEWVESYQVFGQSTFESGALVRAQTLDQDIQFGQTCVMEANGTLDPATGPVDQSGIFHFDNEYGTIHVGVNSMINGVYLPIFVSPNIVAGTADLEPIVSVMAWFDLKLETSVMFLEAISNSIEVTYQGTTSHTISYQGAKVGVWVLEDANGMGMVQPRRGYSSDTGFFYEDSPADPYAFIEEARSYRNTRAIESAARQAATKCTLVFPSTAAANDARAYLKQKIIPNIHQVVPNKVNDVSFTVNLKLASTTFMKEMMRGETDEQKINEAFTREIEGLATRPTEFTFSNGVSAIVENACVLVALGTGVALDRDPRSESAVIGATVQIVAPDQEWRFIPAKGGEDGAGDGLYYITGAQSRQAFLTVDGEPKQDSPIIHSSRGTLWEVRSGGGGISISVPGTYLSIVLGREQEGRYEVVLREPVLGDKHIWRVFDVNLGTRK